MNDLRMVQPMTLMRIGLYTEPGGPCFLSVMY